MLPKLGVNRHFPKEMITAPSFLGGLDLPRYKDEQAVQHIQIFFRLYNSNDHLGKLMMTYLEYCQLHVGSSECFLNLPYSKYYFLIAPT